MKHCPTCSTTKPLSEFFSNGWYKTKRKYKPTCKACEYKQNRERLNRIIEEFYGALKCVRCGYDKYFGALECHHRNPNEKDLEIGKMINGNEARIKAELAKCDLLCSNCHREVHAGL